MAPKKYHVMVFPWFAFGHMIPALEFSKKLAAKGIKVSFICSARNLQRLPPVPSHLTTNMRFVQMILPSVDGLPENCEATADLQYLQIPYLKMAYDSLQDEFEKVALEDLPDLILFDVMNCWVPESSSKLGVPCAFLSTLSASTLAYLGPPNELMSSKSRTKFEDFTLKPEWIPFPSSIAYMPHEAPIIFMYNNIRDKTGLRIGQRLAKTIEGSDFVAVRSSREFEREYIDLLERLYKKPVLPVGMLPPIFPENNNDPPEDGSDWSAASQWLDKQEPKSVAFVGFGSEYKMPLEEVHELAHGIELSNLPFFWILRKPQGVDMSELLPTGFLDRTSNRGIVSLGWVPQVKFLAHPAIGGCLFHCGWGTIIESLSFGHPQILMPMIVDQGLNARALVEKGIGLEVPRNENGSFDREEVARCLRVAMVEQEGHELRRQATEMRSIFGNQKLNDEYIEEFIKYIVNFTKQCAS